MVLMLMPKFVAALAAATVAMSVVVPSPAKVAVASPGKPVVEVQFAELLHVPPVPPIHSWSTAQEIWGQAATIAARWAGRKRTSGLRFIMVKKNV